MSPLHESGTGEGGGSGVVRRAVAAPGAPGLELQDASVGGALGVPALDAGAPGPSFSSPLSPTPRVPPPRGSAPSQLALPRASPAPLAHRAPLRPRGSAGASPSPGSQVPAMASALLRAQQIPSRRRPLRGVGGFGGGGCSGGRCSRKINVSGILNYRVFFFFFFLKYISKHTTGSSFKR